MFDKGQEIILGTNHYRLESLLSTQGGHACVWLASSASQEGQFVVKYPNFTKFRHKTLADFIKRANVEADLLRQFSPDVANNHICPLHDSGTTQTPIGDIPVIVLPYLPGKLPDDIKDGEANYSISDALHWLKQISMALRYLHEAERQQLIHRDLKPGNVLLDNLGDIRLIDLGIAKPTRLENGNTTSSMLTTQWAAPEQIIPIDQHADGTRLFRISTSADIYSLGLLAYYLLSQGKSITYQVHVISRSHTNLGNQYWQEQQQQLKTWEQALTDLACLTEDKRRESDKSQFITHLKALVEGERKTVSPNGTLISTLSPMLPDAEWLANQCWGWVAQLLSPLPEQRPNAQQVIHYLDQTLLMLRPSLDRLLVQAVPSQIAIGELPKFTVTLQGKNLPPIVNWLQVILDGSVMTDGLTWTLQMPAGSTLGVHDELVAHLQLSPLQTAGKFELEVIGEVQGQDFRAASCTFIVVQTASQLWEQGKHADAILLEPHSEWLDALAEQLDGSLDAAFQHLQFLRTVEGKYPEQPALQQRLKAFNQLHPSPIVASNHTQTRSWIWASSGAFLGAIVAFTLSTLVSTPPAPPLPDNNQILLQQQLEAITKERDQLKQMVLTLETEKETKKTSAAIPANAPEPVTAPAAVAVNAPEPVATPAVLSVPPASTGSTNLEKAKDILLKQYQVQYPKLPELLQPLLEEKNHEAMRIMGVLYISGIGVKRDKQEACKLFKDSAALGNPQAGKLYNEVKCS